MKVLANLKYSPDPEKLPAWLAIPDSAIIKNGNPFFVPDFDTSFSAVPFLALKITKLGKSVAPRFAHRYFEEATVALLVFADTMLENLRAAGLPWTAATCFDRSCILGEFFKTDANTDRKISIRTYDGTEQFILPTADAVNNAISAASADNTLKTGDLILLPLIPTNPLTQPGLATDIKMPMRIDTQVEAALENQIILKFRVK